MPEALKLKFHGRILDHLGIQMYQGPVAAIAELIANAWDADAENLLIILPNSSNTIIIQDDGIGMTFNECQNKYLNVGYNRRRDDPIARSPEKGRPILGRKGIGKFAGFGIAQIVEVTTVSKITGEKTVFELNIEQIRQDQGEYVAQDPMDIQVVEYLPPAEDRKGNHGTIITLKELTFSRSISHDSFAKSMSRRFLLHQNAADFKIFINGLALPDDVDNQNIEFQFPRDYDNNERPPFLEDISQTGWGTEKLSEDLTIQWRFNFYNDTIKEEELQGISVFANGKLVQSPFLFGLTGGVSGQAGIPYLSGQVSADFLDQQGEDITAPERQRVNWDHRFSRLLWDWGHTRVKQLLYLWTKRRGEEKVKAIKSRVNNFSQRLDRLPSYERSIVLKALHKIAGIDELSTQQFIEMGTAVMAAWEGGRLKELISQMANIDEFDSNQLLNILIESDIITALHTTEAIRAKLLIVQGLEQRIQNKELENAVRDYIANNPWLISPEWETFAVERSIWNLVEDAAGEAGIDNEEDWSGRVDLVLASGDQLLLLEFMRPGLAVDYDHITRFSKYFFALRARTVDNPSCAFNHLLGYLVADKITKTSSNLAMITTLEPQRMFVREWKELLRRAEIQWKEFFHVLISRVPEDDRITTLAMTEPLSNDQE